MKAWFHTLGCKVNQYETQAMRHLLEEADYETAEFTPGQPDVGEAVLVINSAPLRVKVTASYASCCAASAATIRRRCWC